MATNDYLKSLERILEEKPLEKLMVVDLILRSLD